MTTTDASPVTAETTRTAAAAILRAVADLIEARPDIPLPGSDISFYLRGDDTPATMAAVAAALPCQWQGSISRSGEHGWLNLQSGPRAVIHGTCVRISAPAADACTPAGARTVTVWQPATTLTGFLGTRPLGEAE